MADLPDTITSAALGVASRKCAAGLLVADHMTRITGGEFDVTEITVTVHIPVTEEG